MLCKFWAVTTVLLFMENGISIDFARQNGSKWRALSESHIETTLTGQALVLIKDFESKLLLEIFINCITDDQPYKFLILKVFLMLVTCFWCWWPAQWALSKNCAKRKYFNSNLYRICLCMIIKALRTIIEVKNSGVSCLTWIFNLNNLESQNENPASKQWVQLCKLQIVMHSFQ